MKKLIFLFFLSFIFSCVSRSSEDSKSAEGTTLIDEITWESDTADQVGIEEEMVLEGEDSVLELRSENFFDKVDYTVDTLLMDPGDALVNLQYGLSRASLSADKRKLYALHPALGILYIFDLEEKRLIEQIKFEKDGPNSIPLLVWNFQLLAGSKFLMSDYNKIGIYDSKATKTETITLGPQDFKHLSEGEETSLLHRLQVNETHQKLFSIPDDPDLEKVGLAILDKKTGKTQIVPLPEFGFLTRFDLIYKEGTNSTVSNMAELDLRVERNRIIIYSVGTSSVYFYDITSGSLKFRSPDHQLVPKQKVPPNSRTFANLQQFEEAYFKLLPQIGFHELIYDDKSGVYFRFGSISESTQDLSSLPVNKIYLFAYDRDFNLVGESHLQGLSKVPNYPFFKDGKLWSYVNVNDELGFAVMDFKF